VADVGAWAKMVQQITQFTTMIQQQATSLANQATNLVKIPNLNFGNIGTEVSSVSAQGSNIPAQIRGIVSTNQILANAPADAARTAQTNAAAAQANGAQQQAQVSNLYLGQISSTLQQKNAADAARDQAAFANTATAANDLGTIEGVPIITDP
jgi:hypothetical protein